MVVATEGLREPYVKAFSLAMKSKQFKSRRVANNNPNLVSVIDKRVASALKANIEEKVTYGNTNAVSIDFSGTVASMTGALVRGDAAIDNSTGVIIKPQRLRIRGTVTTNQTSSAMRLIVFQWKDASLPVGAGILASTGSATAPYYGKLWGNRYKLNFLYDELIALFPRGTTTYDSVKFEIDIKGRMADIHLAANGTGTQPQLNGLFFFVISDDGVASYPTISYASELSYTDA